MHFVLGSVAWPTSLKEWMLDVDLEVPFEALRWPPSLERLVFRSRFNMPIIGALRPASLQQISFSSTIPSLELCGRLLCYSCHLEIVSTNPSPLCSVGFSAENIARETIQPAIAGIMWPACLQNLLFETKM